MKRVHRLQALLVGFVFLLACGCSRGSKVTGVVTLDGKPLASAQVVFVPQGGKKADKTLRGASTTTDSDGKFEVRPRKGDKEALKPGKYTVFITRLVDKNGKVPTEEDFGILEAEGKLHDELKDKFNDQETPQLGVEIKPGDNELKPFDLKSK
jgi:hypothetical protein